MFGCLNQKCKGPLAYSFEFSFILIISYMVKLSLVNILSMGLAAHSTRFNSHRKNNKFIAVVAVLFLAITGIRFASMSEEFEQSKVYLEATWHNDLEVAMFPFASATRPNSDTDLG